MSEPDDPGFVTPIGVEDLNRLGMDSENNLYWDGRRVETRQRLSLTWWQNLGAFLVSAGAILGGVGAAVTGAKDGSEMLCQRGHPWYCAETKNVALKRKLPPLDKPQAATPETTSLRNARVSIGRIVR
jgi:hypothetical protein